LDQSLQECRDVIPPCFLLPAITFKMIRKIEKALLIAGFIRLEQVLRMDREKPFLRDERGMTALAETCRNLIVTMVRSKVALNVQEVLMAVRKFRVLFLCTGNACRSQMAEGWARHLWPDRLEAFSAGCPLRG